MRSVSVNDDSSKKLINSSHSSLQLLPPKATDSDRLLTLFFYFFPQVCYPATCSTPSWTGTATHTMPRPAPSQMRKPSTLPLQVIQVTIIYLFNELEWSTASRKYVMMMALALLLPDLTQFWSCLGNLLTCFQNTRYSCVIFGSNHAKYGSAQIWNRSYWVWWLLESLPQRNGSNYGELDVNCMAWLFFTFHLITMNSLSQSVVKNLS